MLLWLAINWQHPTGDIQYPSPDSYESIPPLLTRLLAGHTKGILQIITTTTREARIDFLHRTAFDWARLPERRRQIESHSPGFDPLVAFVATFSSRLRNRTFSARKGQYKGKEAYELFRVFARVDHLSASKDVLTAVLHQTKLLDATWNGQSLNVTRYLSRRYLAYREVEEIPSSHGMDILTTAWCCRAYIRARCDTVPGFLQSRPHILEAAVLGGPDRPGLGNSMSRLGKHGEDTRCR